MISALRKALPKDFLITSGDDATFVEAMHLGAQGVISVVSHVVPRLCVDASKIKNPYRNESSLVNFGKYPTMFRESNPIPVKWALCQMGIIEFVEVRLPLVELSEKFYHLLLKSLKTEGSSSAYKNFCFWGDRTNGPESHQACRKRFKPKASDIRPPSKIKKRNQTRCCNRFFFAPRAFSYCQLVWAIK